MSKAESYQDPEGAYNLTDFANKYFQEGAQLTFAKYPLECSLLKLNNREEVEVACVINVAILRFMTDLPEPTGGEDDVIRGLTIAEKERQRPVTWTFKRKFKEAKRTDVACAPALSTMNKLTTNLEKIHFIAGTGIYRPNLRDEIYCQLCRQLVDNVSRTSFSRGWILMALCVGCFPPSRGFTSYLMNFLRLGPPGYGEYCAARLQRNLEAGVRQEPPSALEMHAAKKQEPISLSVATMDGKEHAFKVDSAVRCKHLCARVKERVGMESAYGFSIYIVCLNQIANWGSSNESVLDAICIAEQHAMSKGVDDQNAWKLYLRRELFPPVYDPSTEPLVTDLTYAQILRGIQQEEYKCDEVSEVLEMVAKRYYVEHGADIIAKKLKELLPISLPTAVLSGFTEHELVFKISEMFGYIPEIVNRHPPEDVKAQVVRLAMTKWPRKFSKNFEAFLVSGSKVPKGDVIIAVNSVGVNVFASNAMRPFSFGLEYSRITKVASDRKKDSEPMVKIKSHNKSYTFRAHSANEIRDLIMNQLQVYTRYRSQSGSAGVPSQQPA